MTGVGGDVGIARRDFLRGALGMACVPLFSGIRAKSCILLVLTGGPSHLDTWDMKPDAPSGIRGPFRPIRTNVPGIEISEIFPRMAKHADKYALIRSVYSSGPPSHENGLRMIDKATAGHITLPGPIGFMGRETGVFGSIERPHPSSSFAENCQRAVKLVENGAAFVRVNMFGTVFHRPSWDSHGTRPFSTFRDYREITGPAFDSAYTSLLEELTRRGLLKSTLVIATGEFGRTPRINPAGGRDHWNKCWTVVMAGGGMEGGQTYGSSDAIGAEPKDHPIDLARILATMPVNAV